MKRFIRYFAVLLLFFSVVGHASTESNLKVTSVGAWAQGSKTFYFKVDRTIGPENCRSNLVKVDLYADSDSTAELMSKNMIRSLALAAFASDSSVQLTVKSTCLYNNPTIEQMWLHK